MRSHLLIKDQFCCADGFVKLVLTKIDTNGIKTNALFLEHLMNFWEFDEKFPEIDYYAT